MIPPISTALLSANPQFAVLHQKLTTDILEHDASTRKLNANHSSAETELNKRLAHVAKDHILTTAICNLYGEKSLPPELLEILYIISNYMTAASELELSKAEIEILNPTILVFVENLLTIAPALKKVIQNQRTSLLTIAELSSHSHPNSSSLTTTVSRQLSHLATLQQKTLPKVATAVVNTVTTLLSTLTAHLTLLVTILERSTHGTLSRHTLAHSTHLSTVSATLALKTRILALDARKATYTPAVQEALISYAQELRALSRRLDLQIQESQGELELYRECDGQDGGTMVEVARRYSNVLREIDEVKADIERLEKDRTQRKGY